MHPKRLESRILKGMNRANREFGLIAPKDRILVALSGGKDSYAMLWGLLKMQAAAPFPFELFAYHLDQGQPGHDTQPIEGFIQGTGVPYEIEYQNTYTRVVEGTQPGKIYCALCSRFRRAILYKAATRNGCNVVALGHHRDDLIETLLLNIFFSGQLKTMPPKLRSQGDTHLLIRPMAYVQEDELIELAALHEFPIVPCNLCGSQQAQRAFVKNLLTELEQKSRHIKGNLLNALGNVKPTHLLDKSLNPLLGESSHFVDIPLDTEVDDEPSLPAPSHTASHRSLPLL
ncbi:MAG: tRNA 2-thiocytidine(32) synthetase TtcA [Myxococcota bacterium]